MIRKRIFDISVVEFLRCTTHSESNDQSHGDVGVSAVPRDKTTNDYRDEHPVTDA